MSDGRRGKGEATSIVAWLRARLAESNADRDRLAHDLAERERLDQVTFAADSLPATAGEQTGPLPALPRRTSSRHARDRTHLRLVKVFLPAAFTGGLTAALRQAWAVHHTVMTAAGVTAAGGAIVLTAAVVTTQSANSTVHGAVVAPNPAASAYQATLIPSPSQAARAAARPGLDARSSRKHLLPVVVAPVPVPSVSSPPRVPSAPPSVPYSPPPAPLLTIPAGPVNLGVYMSTTVQIGNPQDQAVSWSADCGQDVTAVPSQGILEPGQQGVQVRLDINPVDGLSAASCLFEPGGERVSVVWAGAGSASSAS